MPYNLHCGNEREAVFPPKKEGAIQYDKDK